MYFRIDSLFASLNDIFPQPSWWKWAPGIRAVSFLNYNLYFLNYNINIPNRKLKQRGLWVLRMWKTSSRAALRFHRLFCGEHFRKGMRRKRSGRFEEIFLSPERCVECDFCRNTKHTFPELRIPFPKHSARFRTHLLPLEMLLHKIADPIFRLFWHYGFFCAKISVKH